MVSSVAYLVATQEKKSLWIQTWSDTNRPVQLLKNARCLKFWLQVKEEFYYPCSENKDADQLCSYCTADQHLCFRIGKSLVSQDVALLYLILLIFTFF